MTTTYCTLTDTVTATTLNFNLNPDWEPAIKEIAQVYYPLGNKFPTKSTDGTKGVGGILKVITTSDADDNTFMTLLQSDNPLRLTLPNGNSYLITWDPQIDRKGAKPYSQWLWAPTNTWTAYYIQIG